MNAKRRLYVRRGIDLGVPVRIRQRGLILRVNVADAGGLIIPPGRAAGALGRDLEVRRVDVRALFQDGVVRVGVGGRGVVAAVDVVGGDVSLWLVGDFRYK